MEAESFSWVIWALRFGQFPNSKSFLVLALFYVLYSIFFFFFSLLPTCRFPTLSLFFIILVVVVVLAVGGVSSGGIPLSFNLFFLFSSPLPLPSVRPLLPYPHHEIAGKDTCSKLVDHDVGTGGIYVARLWEAACFILFVKETVRRIRRLGG